jgi:hypothetical protein
LPSVPHTALHQGLLLDLPTSQSLDSIEDLYASSTSMSSRMRAHALNAAAMFVGILTWMAVYYAKDEFQKIDEDNEVFGYILHCMALEVISSFCMLPLEYLALQKTEPSHQVRTYELKKEFILGTLLCYEPASDLFISMCDSGSAKNFVFEKYADPSFTPREIIAGFLTLGVGYGTACYVFDKLLTRCMAPVEVLEEAAEVEEFREEDAELFAANSPRGKKFLQNLQVLLRTSKMEAFSAGLQFFVFYLTDIFFDDGTDFAANLLDMLGSGVMMSTFCFLMDALPDLVEMLENKCYPALPLPQHARLTFDPAREPEEAPLPATTVVVAATNLQADLERGESLLAQHGFWNGRRTPESPASPQSESVAEHPYIPPAYSLGFQP